VAGYTPKQEREQALLADFVTEAGISTDWSISQSENAPGSISCRSGDSLATIQLHHGSLAESVWRYLCKQSFSFGTVFVLHTIGVRLAESRVVVDHHGFAIVVRRKRCGVGESNACSVARMSRAVMILRYHPTAVANFARRTRDTGSQTHFCTQLTHAPLPHAAQRFVVALPH
jgi:hypothetical protein